MGRIIAIANQKGGVGKTTTAVNLGASLAASRKRVLVVDCDPQGNASSGLGIKCGILNKHLYTVLMGDLEAADAVISTPMELLKLIASHPDLFGVEVELIQQPEREQYLKKRLYSIVNDFDFVILDCPPSLGVLTLNALTAADTILAPIQCEYYALEGLTQLLNTVRRVQRHLNSRLRVEGIVLTMFDSRNRLSHDVASQVRKYFPWAVFKTVIPRNVRLSESPSHGLPVLLYEPHSTGAHSYLALAQEIMKDGRK
jgi:chromosome partitioning protein